MNEQLATAVRKRARHMCEYCHLPAAVHPGTFEIEHVIPKQHHGKTILSNLAYSCLHCNRHKGPNLAGIDHSSGDGRLIRLFNPRRHQWARHFRWLGPILIGRTATGRTTIDVLAINDPIRVSLRSVLLEEGVFAELRQRQ